MLREATPADIESIRSVHRAAITGLGSDAYDDEQVEAWARGVESADYAAIEDDDYCFLVAEDGDDVVGFGSVRFESPDDYGATIDAEVTAVYVHPSVAREGVGSTILDALERRARDQGVRTLGLSSSLNAVPFYETHGYERVREYTHEFSSGEATGIEGRVVQMRTEL